MPKIDDELNRREVLKRVAALTGGALSASVMMGMMSGANFAQSTEIMDAAFSAQELELVSQMVDMIIPDTDTPGAKAAGVDDYIHVMVSQWYYTDEKNKFLVNLSSVDQKANSAFGKDFIHCSVDERTQILTDLDDEEQDDFGNKTFFQEFKELTLIGYFTSQIGAEQELRYEQYPGPYQGCVPFEKVGRTWAT